MRTKIFLILLFMMTLSSKAQEGRHAFGGGGSLEGRISDDSDLKNASLGINYAYHWRKHFQLATEVSYGYWDNQNWSDYHYVGLALGGIYTFQDDNLDEFMNSAFSQVMLGAASSFDSQFKAIDRVYFTATLGKRFQLGKRVSLNPSISYTKHFGGDLYNGVRDVINLKILDFTIYF
jgi:hypothetical protein